MSMIRNGDEVLVLRHTTKDMPEELNSDWSETFQAEEKLIAIAFENKGSTEILINNSIKLAVGDAMLSFKGEIGVYKKQQWKVAFATVANSSCIVYKTFETGSFLESVKIPLTVGV